MAARSRSGKFASELPELGYEAAVKSLQRAFAHSWGDPAPKPPRPPAEWLKGWDGSHLKLTLDETDLAELVIAFTLRSGDCYVGQVEQQYQGSIVVHLIGGRRLRIGYRAIRRASLLPTHSFEERRIVCRRQACGEPACTFPIAAKVIDGGIGISPPTT